MKINHEQSDIFNNEKKNIYAIKSKYNRRSSQGILYIYYINTYTHIYILCVEDGSCVNSL